jgi:hypothetical protein
MPSAPLALPVLAAPPIVAHPFNNVIDLSEMDD